MKLARATELGNNSPISDLEQSHLDLNQWTNGTNYVLRDGKIQTFNGESLVSTATATNIAGYVDFVSTPSGNYYIVAGRTGVQVTDGTTWTNINNVAGYASLGVNDELKWTGCRLGSIPVLNNPQSFPEYWSPQTISQKMQDLKFDAATTWRSRGFKCNVIRSHKNFLFALNLNEGGIAQPNAYRWSHPADVGGLPFSWDPTDLSSIASKESISDSSYEIIDGLSLRDEFCIYMSRSIHLLQYVGGEFTFQRRELSNSVGCLATDCVVEAVGSHFILTTGDIVMNTGSTISSVLNLKNKRYLESTLSTANYKNCFAVRNYITKELWFFIVQEGFTYPNIAFIINYDTGTISLRDIAGDKASACFGPKAIADDTWEANTQTWEENNEIWDLSDSSVFDYNIVAINSAATSLYSQEKIASQTAFNTVLSREDFVLDGQDEVTTITRVYPHIRCAGQVQLELGSKDSINAPIRWKPAIILDVANSQYGRKVDIRTTGKLHSWRITSVGNTPFELSGFDIEYELAGRR